MPPQHSRHTQKYLIRNAFLKNTLGYCEIVGQVQYAITLIWHFSSQSIAQGKSPLCYVLLRKTEHKKESITLGYYKTRVLLPLLSDDLIIVLSQQTWRK